MGWKILVIAVIVLVLIFGGPNIFKDNHGGNGYSKGSSSGGSDTPPAA